MGDRHDEILLAARQVMADFGLRRATMGDVAGAAGVSRQTVYEYFDSREGLVRASLVAGARDVVQRGARIAEGEAGDPEERLAVLLEVALGFLRTSPLWATRAKRAELVPFVTLEGSVFLGAGRRALEETLTAWWPDADDAAVHRAGDTLARMLVSHGLAPEEADVRPIARGLAALVARGLSARPGATP